MSNQSGIEVGPDLAKEFPDFVASSDVAAILAIDHAKEHVKLEKRVSGTVDDVRSVLEPGNEAKYVVLRTSGSSDSDSEDLAQFAFVQFMPDAAPLPAKMKYASSHATIHRQLGGSSTFGTTIFWTDLDEVSHRGLQAHADHENAPAPLTEEEQSLATAKEFETTQGSRGSSVAGQSTLAIHANVSPEAKEALTASSGSGSAAAVFKVASDDSESIELVQKLDNAAELANHLAEIGEPRYVVANVDGKTVFAFVCPRTSSIKQRMLFASTRISFLEYLKTLREVDALIETFEPETDLQIKALRAELAPLTASGSAASSGKSSSSVSATASSESLAASSRPKFQRPRPPRRR